MREILKAERRVRNSSDYDGGVHGLVDTDNADHDYGEEHRCILLP